MITITIWGVPVTCTAYDLKKLIEEIQQRCIAIDPALEVAIFIPCDRVSEGLGEEIVVDITIPGYVRDQSVLKAALHVGELVTKFFPCAKVRARRIEVVEYWSAGPNIKPT